MNLSAKLLATLACILWGSAFASAKYAFGFMPPILLSGMRFMLAGLLLLPLLRYQKIEIVSTIKHHWKFMSLFAFMQTFLQYGVFYMGLDRVPADVSAIIIGAGPLFVMVMAHFTMKGEKITGRKILALALALSGVVFISLAKGGVNDDSNFAFYIGVVMLVFSNIIGSYTNIMVAKYKHTLSPILLTSFANFTGGVMLLGCGFALENFPNHSLSWEFYASLLWLAFIPAAAFSVWYSLLQREGVKVSDLNMWKFIIPVSGCVLSWIFLANVSPDWSSVIGIVVITYALKIYNSKGKA